MADSVQALKAQAQEKKTPKSKEGGNNYITWLDTDKAVMTRFPPEPTYELTDTQCLYLL